MPTLINNKTQALEDIPQDQLQDTFLNGTHSFQSGQTVPIKNEFGQLGQIAPQEVHQAITQGGYKLPSQAELTEASNEAKYGDTASGLRAAEEAAIGTATFGLGREALNKLGLSTPEGQAQRAARNPVASTLGGIAGIAAPLALGDLAAPLAGADALNPVVGIAKVSQGAAKAAEGVLGRAGAAALGSAVEGAAYGAGNVLNEHALGSPNLNAQSILSQVGMTSLLMGTLGGAGVLAKPYLPEILGGASKSVSNLAESAAGIPEGLSKTEDLLSSGMSSASGVPKENIDALIRDRHIMAQTPEAKAAVASEFADSLAETKQTIDKALKVANKEVRGAETEKLLVGTDPSRIYEEGTANLAQVDNAVRTMRSEPDLYSPRLARETELVRDGLQKRIAEAQSPHDIFEALNTAKQTLDENMPYGKMIAEGDRKSIQVLTDLRGQLRTSLENPEVFGEAGSRQAAFNNAQHEYLQADKALAKALGEKVPNKGAGMTWQPKATKMNTYLNQISDPRGVGKSEALENWFNASKNLTDQMEASYKALPEKQFDRQAVDSVLSKAQSAQAAAQKQAAVEANRKMIQNITGQQSGLPGAGLLGFATGHPIVGAALGAAKALRNPVQTVQTLANIERLLGRTQTVIKSGIAGIVKHEGAEATASLEKELGDNVLSMKNYKKRIEMIKEAAANPEALAGRIGDATSHLAPHAPDTVSAMGIAASAAVAFLASKLPQTPDPGPYGHEWEPSSTEIAKFNRYYQGVQNPLSILKDAQNGSLSPETLEAAAAVHPELYTHIQTQLMQKSAQKGVTLPYQSKMMISMILGQNVVPSLSRGSVQANQALLQPTMPAQIPGQQGPKSSRGPHTLKNLNVSGRYNLPMTQSILRIK